MSAEATVQGWAGRLIAREADRSHSDKIAATKAVARAIGLAPGSLENVARGRAKRLTFRITEAIRGAMIRELQREIARLQHDLELARACGTDPRSLQVSEIEACLARAQELLKEGIRPA